jgi:hypothetical protein
MTAMEIPQALLHGSDEKRCKSNQFWRFPQRLGHDAGRTLPQAARCTPRLSS